MIRESTAPSLLHPVEPAWVETLRSTRPDTSGPTRLEPAGELEFVVARRYEATRGQLFATEATLDVLVQEHHDQANEARGSQDAGQLAELLAARCRPQEIAGLQVL